MGTRIVSEENNGVKHGCSVCLWAWAKREGQEGQCGYGLGPVGVASLVLSMKWELWNVFCRGVHALTSILEEHLTLC